MAGKQLPNSKQKKDVLDIEKVLSLSNKHITEHDNDRLRFIFDSDEKPLSFQVVPLSNYGFLVSIDNTYFNKKGQPKVTRDGYDVKDEILYDFELSEHFLRLISMSVRNGCIYMKVSPDGNIYSGIRKFEW